MWSKPAVIIEKKTLSLKAVPPDMLATLQAGLDEFGARRMFADSTSSKDSVASRNLLSATYRRPDGGVKTCHTGGGIAPKVAPRRIAWTFDPQLAIFLSNFCRKGSIAGASGNSNFHPPPLSFGDFSPLSRSPNLVATYYTTLRHYRCDRLVSRHACLPGSSAVSPKWSRNCARPHGTSGI